jgi:hypothetical protein
MFDILGNIVGSLIGADGAKSAAKTQSAAADRATQLQKEMYDQTVTRNQPFVQGGTQALNALLGRLGVGENTGQPGFGSLGMAPTAEQVMAEPGYEFGRSQGMQALQNALNAKGMSYSGAALKAATRYGNDYASGQYGNAFNRMQGANQQTYNMLSGVSNMGQAAANNTASAGTQFATQAGNNTMNAANVGAASQIAQGNIWQNALNQGVSQYKQSQMPPLNPYTMQIGSTGLPNYALDPYGP